METECVNERYLSNDFLFWGKQTEWRVGIRWREPDADREILGRNQEEEREVGRYLTT